MVACGDANLRSRSALRRRATPGSFAPAPSPKGPRDPLLTWAGSRPPWLRQSARPRRTRRAKLFSITGHLPVVRAPECCNIAGASFMRPATRRSAPWGPKSVRRTERKGGSREVFASFTGETRRAAIGVSRRPSSRMTLRGGRRVLSSWPCAQRVFRGGVPKSTRTASVACRVDRVTLIAMPGSGAEGGP